MYKIHANHEKKTWWKSWRITCSGNLNSASSYSSTLTCRYPYLLSLTTPEDEEKLLEPYNLFAVCPLGVLRWWLTTWRIRLKGIRAERVSQLWRRWYAWGDRYLWCWLHNRWSSSGLASVNLSGSAFRWICSVYQYILQWGVLKLLFSLLQVYLSNIYKRHDYIDHKLTSFIYTSTSLHL